jgi:hypothetical protein
MSLLKLFRLFTLLLVLAVPSSRGEQPIFNEMPRWDGGWGFQFIQEYRHERDLLSGNTVVGPGFSEDIHLLHLEGVYTWDKSIRLTFKLPYVLDARRELLGIGGSKFVQHDEGFGDATVALPLKRYFNLDGRSGSWTLAPQLGIPFARDDAYAVYDHQWGNGLSLGYETETYRFKFGVGATGWVFYGDDEAELTGNIEVGYNLRGLGSNGHIKWSNRFHYEDDGAFTISTGPVLYWRFTDTIHGQIDWLHDLSDRQGLLDHGNGNAVRVGVGFVF